MSGDASLLGRYRLVERVGAGGIGTVHRATDTRTGAVVAVKVLHPHLADDAEYARRFHRGAEIARRLQSPHVVRVLDDGQDGERHFLVMEYVHGKTLAQLLQQRGRLGEGEARRIIMQVAEALVEADRQDVVHRDISPGNILLGKDGVAKVSDFDTARTTDATRMTSTGMFIGKVRYAALETYAGRSDIRSDIYSLGVVIYEMLKGRVPFEADTPLAVIELQRTSEPAGLDELDGLGDGMLGRVVRVCLARQPEERFQTPQALLAALVGEVSGDATLPLPSRKRRRRGRSRLRPRLRLPRGPRWRYVLAGGGAGLAVVAVLVSSMTFAGGGEPRQAQDSSVRGGGTPPLTPPATQASNQNNQQLGVASRLREMDPDKTKDEMDDLFGEISLPPQTEWTAYTRAVGGSYYCSVAPEYALFADRVSYQTGGSFDEAVNFFVQSQSDGWGLLAVTEFGEEEDIGIPKRTEVAWRRDNLTLHFAIGAPYSGQFPTPVPNSVGSFDVTRCVADGPVTAWQPVERVSVETDRAFGQLPMPEGTTMNMHQWGSSVVNDACREPGGQGTNDGKLLDATSYVAPVSPEEALSFFTTTMPTEWSLITSEPGYFSTGLWRKGNLLVDMFATEFVDSSQSSVQVRRCVVGATSPDGG